MIEAYSNGKWTLDFKNISLQAAVTDVTNEEYKGKEFQITMRYPILEKIYPFNEFRNLLLDHINEYDTIVVYWSGKDVAVAAGGGPNYYPLVPYQLYSPLRGWVVMSIGSAHGFYPEQSWNYTVLFHELFHCISHFTCIEPNNSCISIHEFTDAFRYKIPQWRGDGELSYYNYRFSKTLSKIGWNKLSFIKNYPMKITKDQIKNNILAIKNKSIIQLKKSYDLSQKASKEKNQKKKISFINKSLKLNPVNTVALKLKINSLSDNTRFHLSKKLYEKYLTLKPDDHFIHYKYGLLLAKNNHYNKAIKYFSLAIEGDP